MRNSAEYCDIGGIIKPHTRTSVYLKKYNPLNEEDEVDEDDEKDEGDKDDIVHPIFSSKMSECQLLF